MNKALLLLLLLVGAGGAYYWWHIHNENVTLAQLVSSVKDKIQNKQTQNIAPDAPLPSSAPVDEETGATGKTGLPALGESDAFLMKTLLSLMSQSDIDNLLLTDNILRRIVITVDSVGSKEMPIQYSPLKPAPGEIKLSHKEGKIFIGEANSNRYANYLRLLNSLDTQKVAAAYKSSYPLLQKTYKEAGNQGEFKDRLLESLDILLKTPDVTEPVEVVQPAIFYKYANEDIESSAAGQKAMVRIGSKNRAAVKAKLQSLRDAIQSQ